MLFHYKKSKVKQALTLGINILLLPVILYVFTIVTNNNSEFREIYPIIRGILIVIGVVLFALMLWYLRSKKLFELSVTEDAFRSEHPLFNEYCFTVNPKDIKKIQHHYNRVGGGGATINMIMDNGDVHQICMNYPYSRKKLYAALKAANPSIVLPENIWRFKSREN